MSYTYGFDKNTFDKYATIQDDVQDAYIEDVESEDEDDIFGFSKAIEIDHLSDEQLDMIAEMFN